MLHRPVETTPLLVMWVWISEKAQRLTLIFTFLGSVTNLTKPMSATLADRRKLSSSLFAFAAFRTHGILDSSVFSLSSTDLAGSVSENAVSRNLGFPPARLGLYSDGPVCPDLLDRSVISFHLYIWLITSAVG